VSQLAAFDGSGNVVALVDGSSGTYSANYEYGPFGEVIRASGAMASSFPIRWSTKYTDLETDLVYYGYRYYNPGTGRWLSRDPIGEKGGLNLYGFVN
jgi:RHS repeat-associated protein